MARHRSLSCWARTPAPQPIPVPLVPPFSGAARSQTPPQTEVAQGSDRHVSICALSTHVGSPNELCNRGAAEDPVPYRFGGMCAFFMSRDPTMSTSWTTKRAEDQVTTARMVPVFRSSSHHWERPFRTAGVDFKRELRNPDFFKCEITKF